MNQLRVHLSASLPQLASAFTAASVQPTADPFARPLLLVPGPGVQRWLSQQVAAGTAEGIMAGFDVHPFGSLEALLEGDGAGDEWEPLRLVWTILDLAGSLQPGLRPLSHHLDSSDQRYAKGLRIARLLRRYADQRPAMLASWSANPLAAASELGFDAWQVHLWRALRESVPGPDPLERRRALASAVASGELSLPWPAVHVFHPHRAPVVQRGFLRALAARVPVDVWLATAGPTDGPHPLATALGRTRREAEQAWCDLADEVVELGAPTPQGSDLATLQAAVLTGGPATVAVNDGAISVHASHGLGRQAEVLREVLTGIFADDPTLEPRDVVIATPDPSALEPHLAALFGRPGQEQPLGFVHPATGLRVQVTDAGAAAANQVHLLLLELLQLGATHATLSQLLSLASHPFVARRFGFGDLERVEELCEAAAIRWGINPAHRSRFGVEGIPQNTWQLGVQRLMMGEAFSEDRLVQAGHVSTVDDVTSTDVALVGALAEFVSRVSRVVAEMAEPCSVGDWADRLRHAVDLLVDVPFADNWQLSQVWSVLGSIEARAEGCFSSLKPADVRGLLMDAFAQRGVRPAFGNGSLVVCSLSSLPRVPHRVVCVVGLDERTFPRRRTHDGDDLVERLPEPGDPDRSADDRQAFLDAVLSAQDRLVVIYQGQSAHTTDPHPAPAGVLELLEAVGEQVKVTEPLHAFARENFTGPSPTFDQAALAAARAASNPRVSVRPRYEVGHLHRAEPLAELALPRLSAALTHPPRFLLKERGDLTLYTEDAPDESIPLTVDHRSRWRMGQTVLDHLLAGHTLDEATTALWLSGTVPPRALGRRHLDDATASAARVHKLLVERAGDDLDVSMVDIEVAGVRLSGRLRTRGGLVAEAHHAKLQAKHRAPAWVNLLALTVATGRRTDALIVGTSGAERLIAPPPELAERFLSELVGVADQATQRILPITPRLGEHWAGERARGRDPKEDRGRLEKLWSFDNDAVWRLWYPRQGPGPWTVRREPGDPWGVPHEDTQLGALSAVIWEPIRKARA